MKVELPSDCGNAPRIGVVSDVTVSWARGNADEISAWLADTASWKIAGGDTYEGPAPSAQVLPTFSPQRVVITAVITHGRLASCDGYLEGDGAILEFCHVFRFATTAKTSKIAEVRSYLVTHA